MRSNRRSPSYFCVPQVEFADGCQPAAEIVVHLRGIEMRQHAGDADHRSLVDRGGGEEFCGGQRGRGPDQRSRRQQALQRQQPRIFISARRPADRGFAGQEPRQFKGRTGPDASAAGIALVAVAIIQQVVGTDVAVDLGERLDARRQIIADTPETAELVVVAIVIAADGAIGQQRVLVDGAVDGGACGKLQPVEALIGAERAAERRVYRVFGEARLHVRASGIVGGDA